MDSEDYIKKAAYLREVKKHCDGFSRETFQISVKYAEMYLKQCFVLNGGSILAFPTLSQIVDVSAKNHLAGFIISLGCFSFGLVASLIAVICASAWFEKKAIISGVNSGYIMKMIENESVKDLNDNEMLPLRNRRDNAIRWSFYYSRATIVSGSISAILFIIGICAAGLVVSELDLILFPISN